MESLHVQDRGRVRVVTIDRPDRRNAVDRATAEELWTTFLTFDDDATVDVAVLAGAGGNFCSGADLKAIAGGHGNLVTEDGPGPLGPTRMQLSKPVIAAVEGYAVAGGLELALWCDLRVAATDATFGVFCRRWGVPLVDGGTVRLPRLIGQSRAMDMILTGRGVDGIEAHAMGLANRVCAPGTALDEAVTLAVGLTELPQRCLHSDRTSVLEQWSLDEPAALANEYRLGIATIASGETLDGASRFDGGAGRHGAADG